MTETPEFVFPVRPGETHRAHRAKRDYCLMGENRGLHRLREKYVEIKSKKQGKPPTTNFSTIAQWSTRFDWVDCARDFDAFHAEQNISRLMEEKEEEYRRQLETFAENHRGLGKAGFKAAAEGLKQILEFLDTHPTIQSWSEATQAAALVRSVFPLGELWARSICVDRLLKDYDPQVRDY